MSKGFQLCGCWFRHWDFVIPPDFVIRHSDLAIAVCSIQLAGQQTGESGSGVGWFMESLLALVRMHWDYEALAVPRQTESADKSDALQTLRAVRRRPAVAKRLECVRLQRRFPKPGYDSMPGPVHGNPLSFLRMHWDLEPTPKPFQERNGQDPDEHAVPSWQGSGVGRFMESLLGLTTAPV